MKVRADRPDLIILDLWMPFMDGREVIRRLTDDLGYRDLSIILLCAKSSNAADHSWDIGFDRHLASYLNKPFSPHELLALVEAPRPGEPPANGPRSVEGINLSSPVQQPTERQWWKWWRR